MMYWIQT